MLSFWKISVRVNSQQFEFSLNAVSHRQSKMQNNDPFYKLIEYKVIFSSHDNLKAHIG